MMRACSVDVVRAGPSGRAELVAVAVSRTIAVRGSVVGVGSLCLGVAAGLRLRFYRNSTSLLLRGGFLRGRGHW